VYIPLFCRLTDLFVCEETKIDFILGNLLSFEISDIVILLYTAKIRLANFTR